MKTLKHILITLTIIISVVFINGCYYVFYGQDKSMQKLQQGKELNLYECCSIYSMHCATWMFGWVLSPEAAKECFKLHFNQPDTVGFVASKKFKNSLKLQQAFNYLKDKPLGTKTKVAWNGNVDYAINSTERNAAIAVNPCTIEIDERYIIKEEYKQFFENPSNIYGFVIESPMIYPKYSKTQFDCGLFTITIHEGLFRYLQDIGWLSKYIARYYCSI